MRIPSMLVLTIAFALQNAPINATTVCGKSQRVIGVFGAENSKPEPMTLDGNIRSQLTQFVTVREVLHTHLSPTGELVIVYDTDADESDPQPAIAFFVANKLVQTLRTPELIDWGGGFERFQTGCPYQLPSNQNAVFFAFTTAFDGTGSVFDIVTWNAGKYGNSFSIHGTQARLVIESGKLSLWTSKGDGECIWCDQHYAIRNFIWRHGHYKKAGRSQNRQIFSPDEISGFPLWFATSDP